MSDETGSGQGGTGEGGKQSDVGSKILAITNKKPAKKAEKTPKPKGQDQWAAANKKREEAAQQKQAQENEAKRLASEKKAAEQKAKEAAEQEAAEQLAAKQRKEEKEKAQEQALEQLNREGWELTANQQSLDEDGPALALVKTFPQAAKGIEAARQRLQALEKGGKFLDQTFEIMALGDTLWLASDATKAAEGHPVLADLTQSTMTTVGVSLEEGDYERANAAIGELQQGAVVENLKPINADLEKHAARLSRLLPLTVYEQSSYKAAIGDAETAANEALQKGNPKPAKERVDELGQLLTKVEDERAKADGLAQDYAKIRAQLEAIGEMGPPNLSPNEQAAFERIQKDIREEQEQEFDPATDGVVAAQNVLSGMQQLLHKAQGLIDKDEAAKRKIEEAEKQAADMAAAEQKAKDDAVKQQEAKEAADDVSALDAIGRDKKFGSWLDKVEALDDKKDKHITIKRTREEFLTLYEDLGPCYEVVLTVQAVGRADETFVVHYHPTAKKADDKNQNASQLHAKPVRGNKSTARRLMSYNHWLITKGYAPAFGTVKKDWFSG